MASETDQRVSFAEVLIKDAGALALSFFQRPDSLVITSKGLQDMVSQADVTTEHLIRDRLKGRFPGDGFLGEETGRADLGDPEYLWVVDPIDGTQPFVSGLSSWCVSIALVVNGTVEAGLVFAPARDELFTGRRGGHAFLNGKPIQVSPASKLTEGLLAVGYSHRVPPEVFLPVFSRLLAAGAIYHREGTGALSLCYVACGRLIGYIEPHINSWDCLGAIAVIEAAGGEVSDFLADDGMWLGNPLLAGPKEVYRELVAAYLGPSSGGKLQRHAVQSKGNVAAIK